MCFGVLSLGSAFAMAAHRLWPRELALRPVPKPPALDLSGVQPALRPAKQVLLAHVGLFYDELLAYMHYEYLRTLPYAKPYKVLLASVEFGGRPMYRIFLSPEDNDLLAAVPYLAWLSEEGFVPGFNIKWWPRTVLADYERQTRMFEAAYHFPVRQKLERLGKPQLLRLTQRFILFKSRTDPRIRRRMIPRPAVLSNDEAQELAADILAVADFYDLPLDFFLGIGAMENNYMNVPGDLDHAVWKRRAQKGDIVLLRRRGRALVLNYATGPWQITRETLRYAHKLFLKDEQDYTALPGRLQPPKKLNLEDLDVRLLTTYAGLLFRHLLDHFDGDVGRAIGAYNGGIGKPNARYEEGVRLAAEYARRILEQAAALNSRSVAETRFFSPPG